ncbi:hypothetical protein EUX98_g6539 [Antrodiella citrinella]|uniref:Uncharacterized protein n=1 Tax=Antrodiella citrinella TaxID=2447956 RepID=A0A4S4MPI3_9APHY|nr:hypothetical protein EUX98_g6539 [Antrodiella citrinella]
MLLINQRLDKLAAARVDFQSRGMLEGSCLLEASIWAVSNPTELPELPSQTETQAVDDTDGLLAILLDKEDDQDPAPQSAELAILNSVNHDLDESADGLDPSEKTDPERSADGAISERGHARTLEALGVEIGNQSFPLLVHHFLRRQLERRSHAEDHPPPPPHLPSKTRVYVHYSAMATYFAPSDPCGAGGMHREYIRATPSWRGGPARYDCAFLNVGDEPGIYGLDVVRIKLLFSFKYEHVLYPCALVHWYSRTSPQQDPLTGMWIVEPDFDEGSPVVLVVHIDTIFRAAHLIGVYPGQDFISEDLTLHDSLNYFRRFYINDLIDYHAYETLNPPVEDSDLD